jgi:predicted nucleic acid-binding protein
MSRVFWDTNLFIYLFEGRGHFCERVVALRERMLERGDELYTSALTLGEILVKPVGSGDEDLAAHYQRSISQAAVVIPFSEDAAPVYARIRADRSLRAPDAIQLACASAAGIDLFITNDDRLARKSVPGIQFLVSLERAFL